MEEGTKQLIWVILGILLFTSICFVGSYKLKELKTQNFQNTIENLSDEQKCIHICGFEFGDYIDSYKFCLEKCDRVSERANSCG